MQNNKYSLIAVNAKYIHSNLAVRYLKNYCHSKNIFTDILEFSINDNMDKILKSIYLSKSNVLAFSCYIWNIEMISKMTKSLKKIRPDFIIILGGPEVSYDSVEIMTKNPSIDYIIFGEGEITFHKLLESLENNAIGIESIYGLVYRNGYKIIKNEKQNPIKNLDIIPFPYDDIKNLENKIIYYETSRGCPFHCQYCLSSLEEGVRYFSLDRAYKDLDFFIDNKIKQVKLVDRTFNCHKERCLSIMEHIIKKDGNTNFHFEISAKLIDSDFLRLVEKAPKGLFQFEIGLQSTNPITLSAIKRKESFNEIKDSILKLQNFGLCHIHLDLIAGLPHENINSFENSFNQAYSLKPDMLQLGFLKLLKGSGLRLDADKYKIQYHNHAPYEVISTECLSYDEVLTLKSVEELLENYYNSGRFKNSLTYAVEKHNNNAFSFYLSLYKFYNDKGYIDRALKAVDLYSILYDYIFHTFGMTLIFNELLKYDYFINFGSPMPKCIGRFDHSALKTTVNTFLKNDENIESYMPELKSMDIRQKLKHISFEVFYADVTGNLEEKEIIIFSLKSKGEEWEDRILSFDMDDFINLA